MIILNINDIKNNIDNIENLTTNDLLCQSARLNYLDGVKLALKRYANINVYDGFPLRTAINHGNYDIVKYLIENNAEINHKKSLLIAFNYSRWNIIKLLILNGADLNDLNDVPKNEDDIKQLNLILREIKLNKIF